MGRDRAEWGRFRILSGASGEVEAPDARLAAAALCALASGPFVILGAGSPQDHECAGETPEAGLERVRREERERPGDLEEALRRVASAAWRGGAGAELGLRALMALAVAEHGGRVSEWAERLERDGLCRCLGHALPQRHDRRICAGRAPVRERRGESEREAG